MRDRGDVYYETHSDSILAVQCTIQWKCIYMPQGQLQKAWNFQSRGYYVHLPCNRRGGTVWGDE